MARISKTVIVTTEVEVEFDSEILPDDEWRETFYEISDEDELAEHFAFNYVNHRINRLTRLDGFADRMDHQMRVTTGEVHVECVS